jgi:hypothetical protein
MMAHLCAVCKRLNSTDIQENDSRMKHPHDPNQPIKALCDQVEDGISLAEAAEAACTPDQIIAIAFNLIFSTGMFPEACREWRRCPNIEKTWTNFKIDFASDHQEFKESQVTSDQAGCQSANAVCTDLQQETALAPANLATATASDRSVVASLTTANGSNPQTLRGHARDQQTSHRARQLESHHQQQRHQLPTPVAYQQQLLLDSRLQSLRSSHQRSLPRSERGPPNCRHPSQHCERIPEGQGVTATEPESPTN